MAKSSSLRPIKLLLGLAFRVAPVATVFAMIVGPLSALSGPLAGIAIKYLIDGARVADWPMMQWALGGLVVALCGFYVLDLIAWQLCLDLEDRTTEAVEKEIVELATGMQDLGLFELEESVNRLEHLRQQGWMLGRAMYILPMQWSGLVRAVFTLGLLGSIHPLLLLLPLFSIPLVLIESRAERAARDAERDTMPFERRSKTFFDFWLRPAAAMEARIFGVQPWLRESERALADQAWVPRRATESRNARKIALGWLVFGAGTLGGMALVLSSVLAGALTLGTLLLAIGLVSQVSGSVSSMVGAATWTQRLFRLSDDLLWLRTRGALVKDEPGAHILAGDISVDGLSFRYAGAERDAVSDLSLTLKAGSVVALVGENGSGKTTLVKLLCGFYEPAKGCISVGKERFVPAGRSGWWTRVSAAFQDAFKFEFLTRETVQVGDLNSGGNPDAVTRAMEQAGATALQQSLPQGLETQLGSRWPGGVELSGGQWQQLALARGLMRPAPALRVFDEPSASLDPRREHALFVRQAEAARRARASAGTITVFVTHAFSTVSMADLIVVMDLGRIRESGTHAELMKQGGLYAELYTTQLRAHAVEKPAT